MYACICIHAYIQGEREMQNKEVHFHIKYVTLGYWLFMKIDKCHYIYLKCVLLQLVKKLLRQICFVK